MDKKTSADLANDKLQTAYFARLRGNTSEAERLEIEAAKVLGFTRLGRYDIEVAILQGQCGKFAEAMASLKRADAHLADCPTRDIETLTADGHIQWIRGKDGLIDALHALMYAGQLIGDARAKGIQLSAGITERHNIVFANVLRAIMAEKLCLPALFFYEPLILSA